MASLWAPTLDPSPTPVQVALSHGHEEAALVCYRAEAAPPAVRPSSRGANLAAKAPSWQDTSARGAQAAELYLRGGGGRHDSAPLYPTGYTGHVAQAKQAVGQTYGRAIRDARDGVTEAWAGAHGVQHGGPRCTPWSTHALAFSHPDRAAPAPLAHHAAAARVGAPQRPTASDPNLLRVSTAQLSYPPPEPEAYLLPRARAERTNPSRSRAAPWAESVLNAA